jgi:hypothetical protein
MSEEDIKKIPINRLRQEEGANEIATSLLSPAQSG